MKAEDIEDNAPVFLAADAPEDGDEATMVRFFAIAIRFDVPGQQVGLQASDRDDIAWVDARHIVDAGGGALACMVRLPRPTWGRGAPEPCIVSGCGAPATVVSRSLDSARPSIMAARSRPLCAHHHQRKHLLDETVGGDVFDSGRPR